MAQSTYLKVVYTFDDGGRSDLAVGTIDAMGQIEVSKVAPGQEDRVNLMVTELNQAERVFVPDLAHDDVTGQTSLVKRSVYRAMPDFLEALTEYARRHYRAELQFDAAALANPLSPRAPREQASDTESDEDLDYADADTEEETAEEDAGSNDVSGYSLDP